jgi:hypothetical protein
LPLPRSLTSKICACKSKSFSRENSTWEAMRLCVVVLLVSCIFSYVVSFVSLYR